MLLPKSSFIIKINFEKLGNTENFDFHLPSQKKKKFKEFLQCACLVKRVFLIKFDILSKFLPINSFITAVFGLQNVKLEKTEFLSYKSCKNSEY
jgi:hypothetical protein